MAVETNLSALPWTSLRAFEAASRLGSFKEAARELSVTPTAISHQIKRLEAHLGLALFERLHRALQLTPAGERLAAEVQDTFLRLQRTPVQDCDRRFERLLDPVPHRPRARKPHPDLHHLDQRRSCEELIFGRIDSCSS